MVSNGPKQEAPENTYRDAIGPAARRRIQAKVVETYRGRVVSYVRRYLAPRHWEEAEQVGCIGLLVALERFTPTLGVPFGFHCVLWIRKEIQRWMNHGVYWRPGTKSSMSKGRKANLAHLMPESMDAPINSETRHDVLADKSDTVEDLVSTAEGLALVTVFLGTLSQEERHMLTCEKRNRGVADSKNVRRYLSLVERARAFVQGSENVAVGKSASLR